VQFKLKFCWKKLFVLFVTSIVQQRNYGFTIKATTVLKPQLTYCDQYYRREQLCGITLEAIVEEGNPPSRLKNVMIHLTYKQMFN
jgi:hypothetical protein